MITITVGQTGIRYSVLESLICRRSKFFDNAMKPEWASSRPDARVIDLSYEQPEVFQVYLHWLYFKILPTVAEEEQRGLNQEHVLLAKCYVMGDKLMNVDFKNAILSAVVDVNLNQPFYKAGCPGYSIINTIYTGT